MTTAADPIETDTDLLGYVVVEWNQASKTPGLDNIGLHYYRAAAEEEADDLRQATAALGRLERYAVCEVRLIEGTEPS